MPYLRTHAPAPRALRLALGLLSLLALAACSDGSDNPPVSTPPVLPGCADSGDCVSNPPLVINAQRPANVYIPVDYTPTTRYPLVVLLHGYGANGRVQTLYMGLDRRVDSKQYILVAPDGTENLLGERFWNATPACCAFNEEDRQVDDVAYISELIREAAATYSIDTNRIGLIGHSNGGFMSLRMACEASELVTAVVSLAGSTFDDPALCAPATLPVSVLTIHGTLDGTIYYDGGTTQVQADGFGGPYPAAPETSMRFAALAGCDYGNPERLDNTDLVTSIPGAETEVLAFRDCVPQADVAFWTIVDGPHIPIPWTEAGQDAMVDWLLQHPRAVP